MCPQVDKFLDWQLESFEKLEKMADPSQMNCFVKSMQRKVKMFKIAWSSSFVSFDVENCINSTFDEKDKAVSMSLCVIEKCFRLFLCLENKACL